jgi:hypothetical protein
VPEEGGQFLAGCVGLTLELSLIAARDEGCPRARIAVSRSVRLHDVGTREPAFPAFKRPTFRFSYRMRLDLFNACRLSTLRASKTDSRHRRR